jgi:hypothetical protein
VEILEILVARRASQMCVVAAALPSMDSGRFTASFGLKHGLHSRPLKGVGRGML